MTRFAVIALLALAPRAFADDAKGEAQKHLQESQKLFQLGNFAEALTEIMTAYTLDPQPGYTFTIAQIHVKLGECTEAIDWYKKFLESHPSAKAAKATKEAITNCEKQLKEHPEAAKPVTPPVNPTPPAETVTKNPNPSATIETTTTLPPANPEPAPPAATPAPSPAPAPAPEPERPTSSHHAWYSDPLVDGCIIGGLAAGAASIVFYRSALDDYDRAETAATYSAHHQLIQDGQSARTVALIAGGGAVALVAAGAVFYVLRDRDEPAVAVIPTSGGAAVTYGGHF